MTAIPSALKPLSAHIQKRTDEAVPASFRESLFDERAHYYPVAPGTTINQWLDASGFRERMNENPIVVILNGREIMESEYDTVLSHKDVLQLQQYPRGIEIAGIALIEWIYYAVVIISAIYTLTMPEPGIPEAADVKEGSPTYSLSAKGNRYRPDRKGPILYGKLRVVPDFDQLPFSTYDVNNDQTLHMLFRITQGEATVDVASIKFEDTPLSNFSGVQTEVIQPGEVPTLFPVGVVESEDISNLELTDSYTTAYVVNEPGTQVSQISVDMTSPGLAVIDRQSGDMSWKLVRVEIQYQSIDDSDNVIGAWEVLATPALTGDDRDPLRRTFDYPVTPGRYQVRMRRMTPKDDSQYVYDTVSWAALKGLLHDPDNTSHCTRLAISVRASEQIGNRSLTKMSVIATRKLPIWDSQTGWTDPQNTQSIAWALADLCRASYAGNRSDLNYDLPRLAQLDAQLTPAGHHFNGYYDTEGITVWDALVKTGTPGRITPIDKAGFYTFVRDEAQSESVQTFTMRNIVKDSFRIRNAGVLEETADSIIVKFQDEENDYRERRLVCALPDSPAQTPREVMLFGVTNATRAKELGMFLAAANRFRRKQTPFSTGIEGRIPFYGNKITISHWLFGASGVPQVSGDIMDYDGTNKLRLSEKVSDYSFSDPHIVMTDLNGQPMPAYPITIISDFIVQVGGSPDWTQIKIERGYKAPMFIVGDGQEYVYESKITKLERDGENVSVECFVDDPRVYIYGDNVVPPPHVDIPGPQDAAPVLSELTAHVGGTVDAPIVTLGWSLQNADRTDIEISDDGGSTWDPLGRGFTLENEFVHRPQPGNYVYRVAAVNLFRGPWVSIQVSTEEAAYNPPLPPDNLHLREPFVGPVLKLAWDSDSYRHYIEVLVNNVVKYRTTIDGTEWDFAGTTAQEWGVGRAFDVHVYAVGENGQTSTTYAEISVSNPAPAQLNNLSVQGLTGLAMVKFDWPPGTDITGINVWMSDTSGFTPGPDNLVVDQSRDPIIGVPIQDGVTVYIRAAAVDAWGTGGLNISGEFETTAATVDLTQVYEELHRLESLFPITETSIADDAISTPKLQANAVDADKLAANSVIAGKIGALAVEAGNVAADAIKASNIDVDTLSAITAKMGTVTSGTFKTTEGTTYRVEISSEGTYPLWIGNGTKNDANALLRINNAGQMLYRGQLDVVSEVNGIRTEIDSNGGRVYDGTQILVRWGRW